MKASGMPVLADDSGLMVDALDGAPGVYSARYGHKSSDAERIAYLLENLKDVPAERRTAKFVCVITCLWPDGRKIVARGECPGRDPVRAHRARAASATTRYFTCRSLTRPMPSLRRRRKTPSPTARGRFRHFAESIGRNLNMMTSKERAELRAQANPLDVTLIVGKGGISQTRLLDEAVVLLDSHELVKGRVLETAGLTAREASDAHLRGARRRGHRLRRHEIRDLAQVGKARAGKEKGRGQKARQKEAIRQRQPRQGRPARPQAGGRAAAQAAQAVLPRQGGRRRDRAQPPAEGRAVNNNTDRGGAQHEQGSAFTAAASIRRIWGTFSPRGRRAQLLRTGQNSLDPGGHPAAQGRGRRLAGRRNAPRAHASLP